MAHERPRALDAAAANTDYSKVSDLIGTHVLHSLGEPEHLHGINVRRLWDHHYRVNVYVGRDPSAITVAHSYFLVADADGVIISSDPIITRIYGPEMFPGIHPAIEGQTP